MPDDPSAVPGGGRVCPVSRSGGLLCSARRWVHNPQRLLRGLVREGETVADLGCGPGYFTLPLARMVGESGCVIAVDLQEGMLALLRERAARAGLSDRIRLHQCSPLDLGVTDPVSFALAFYLVHEVPDVARCLSQVRTMLAPGGRCLLVEPKLHVSAPAFARTVALAEAAGLRPGAAPRVALSRSVLLERAP